jgi:hypothetical protein
MLNRDDIIRMMREAALSPLICDSPSILALCEAVARRSAAAEREACAVLCEQQKDRWVDGSDQWGNPCPARLRATPSSCAAAIRARGQA